MYPQQLFLIRNYPFHPDEMVWLERVHLLQMQSGKKELTFLHFNDAYDIQPDPSGQLGFTNFYHQVRKLRQKHPDSLLIFSGDAFAPSKLSRALKGEQMAYCLSLLNIDVACYGNHDFDFAPEHALKLAQTCKCPWLMGNIKYIETGQNIGNGLDYYIKEHCGIKIGFMGLAGPDFNGRLISAYAKKLKYFDIVEYARQMCKTLLELGCELIIALTHARMPADLELAKKVPQIDFILGGHDHSSVFQVINETPIIKSDSNFQCISIIKIFDKGDGKDVRVGRRWRYTHHCKKIKTTTQEYPQVQKYIKQAVEAFHAFDKARSMAHNPPKKEHVPLPENKWHLQYSFMNNKPVVTLAAGLSAQVCFAKYVAFKRKCHYQGYKRGAPQVRPNFIQQTLKFIEVEVSSHADKGTTVLYSPGICSVPYLVQTGNMIYLPSHFLVGANRLADLIEMLEIAQSQGYKCYAVLGYDPFIQDQLCAWIKFIEPPKEYISLINAFKIDNVVIMSCHDIKGTSHGAERKARLVHGNEQNKGTPNPKGIYAVFVQESYDKQGKKDITNFSNTIKDRDTLFWQEVAKRPICNFIHDWQSGIDCVQTIQTKFRQHVSAGVSFHYILNPDSWKLYLIAYHLGKQFIAANFHEEKHPIKHRGVVFNQYIMSNPTYQLNYGYIPILYWQFYPQNEQRILSVLTQQEKELKRWFNMHKGTRLELMKHDSVSIKTDHLGVELVKWITKYAPKEYELSYLPTVTTLKCLAKQDLLFIRGQEGFVRM